MRLPLDIKLVRYISFRARLYCQHMRDKTKRYFIMSRSIYNSDEWNAYLTDKEGESLLFIRHDPPFDSEGNYATEQHEATYELTTVKTEEDQRQFLLEVDMPRHDALNFISQYSDQYINDRECLDLLTQQQQLGGKPFPRLVMNKLFSQRRKSI